MSQVKVRPSFNFNDLTKDVLPLSTVSEPVARPSKNKNVFNFNEFTKEDQTHRIETVIEKKAEKPVQMAPSIPSQALNNQKLDGDTLESIAVPPPSCSRLTCRRLVSDAWSWTGVGQSIKEEIFSEEMLVALLRGQKMSKVVELRDQIGSQKIKHVHARALTFLTLICHEKTSLQDRVKTLIQWINELAASCKVPLGFEKLPDKLGLIAEGRVDELAREYIARKQWDEALLLTSMNDEMTVEATINSCTNAQLRKVVNFLEMKQLKFLDKTSWIAELSLVLRCCYFEGNTTSAELSKYIKEIYTRYIGSQPLMGCELIALMFEFQKEQRIVTDTHVSEFAEKSSERLELLNLAQLFSIIQNRNQQFPSSTKIILHKILTQIQNPEHILLMLASANIQRPEDIKQAMDLCLQSNHSFQQTEVCEDVLAASIRESPLQCTARDVLYNWVVCREIQQLQARGEHFAFLRRLVQDEKQVKRAFVIKIQTLLERLEDTLTNFQLACSYKQHRRSEYFKLLLSLQQFLSSLPTQRVDVSQNLLKGCLALIKIREGAFSLREDLSSLYWLVEYITTNNDKIQHSKPFLQYIKNTVCKCMKSPDGALFIRQICSSTDEEGKSDRTLLKQDVLDRKGGIRQEFAEGPVYQLLQVVSWDRTVRGDILIHLHHD